MLKNQNGILKIGSKSMLCRKKQKYDMNRKYANF